MRPEQRRTSGLGLGLGVLAAVSLGFLALFLIGPGEQPPAPAAPPLAQSQPGLLDVLSDPPTRGAVAALQVAAPATYAELEVVSRAAIANGAGPERLATITLEALFAQFQHQAGAIKGADSDGFQSVVAGLRDGLEQMKAADSPWCDGAQIAAFLSQNDADLVPSLLAEFPYDSPQYAWAMGWMTRILTVARQGQTRPERHARPGFRDEATLQQTGLALGSEQWALGLQIAAFANSEGRSYAQMQDVVGNMDVCELGVAVEIVSERLPDDVRARIWADLMPEVMVGNTPYVMYRVTDYFFIG